MMNHVLQQVFCLLCVCTSLKGNLILSSYSKASWRDTSCVFVCLGGHVLQHPCADELADIAVFPDSPRYSNLTLVFNPSFANTLPAFVALPQSVDDVQRCLSCAYQHNTPFTMKAGGHSAIGMSTINGSSNGGFVVYLTELKSIVMSNDSATIQTGALWGDVYYTLKQTNYLIPGGDILTVGVAGYTLGGGRSIASRTYGLAIDNVLSFTMVTVSGSDVVVANSTLEPDLYWALRGGGGGNFGVVVDITFKLQQLSFGSYRFGYMLFRGENSIAQVLPTIGAEEFDHHLSMELILVPGETLNLTYTILGPISSFTEDKLTLLKKHSSVDWESSYSTYWQALDARFSDQPRLGSGQPFIPRACLLNTLSATFTKLLLEVATPKQCVHKFNQLGGKIAEYAPNASAYPHRNASFEIYSFCSYKDSTDKDFVGKYVHNLYLSLTDECIGNYVNDPELDLQDWQHKYYGLNYKRLVDVQNKWNPLDKGTYHYPQSIGSTYNTPSYM